MSITFAIAGDEEGDKPGRRVTITETLISYLETLQEQMGLNVIFFLGLDPFKSETYEGKELVEVESYLAKFEDQLADILVHDLPAGIEPPIEFGEGREGEGTESREEGVLEIIASLLGLFRQAIAGKQTIFTIPTGEII